MKKLLKVIALCNFFVVLVCLTSCGNNGNSNANISNNSDITTVETMKKHTIQLTMDNYLTYIEIRGTTVVSSTSSTTTYVFEGALDYAYYDNVVISYKVNDGDIKETKLSAGGYGKYFSTNSRASSTTEIVGVSGNVIYWM